MGGSGLLPAVIGVQTVLLLALRRAAANAERPLLSANIMLWEAATAAAVDRCTHVFPHYILLTRVAA